MTWVGGLAISIPTILIGLVLYKRKKQLSELQMDAPFIVAMCAGSILGAFVGSYLLRYVASSTLHIFLGAILLSSAVKIARNSRVH